MAYPVAYRQKPRVRRPPGGSQGPVPRTPDPANDNRPPPANDNRPPPARQRPPEGRRGTGEDIARRRAREAARRAARRAWRFLRFFPLGKAIGVGIDIGDAYVEWRLGGKTAGATNPEPGAPWTKVKTCFGGGAAGWYPGGGANPCAYALASAVRSFGTPVPNGVNTIALLVARQNPVIPSYTHYTGTYWSRPPASYPDYYVPVGRPWFIPVGQPQPVPDPWALPIGRPAPSPVAPPYRAIPYRPWPDPYAPAERTIRGPAPVRRSPPPSFEIWPSPGKARPRHRREPPEPPVQERKFIATLDGATVLGRSISWLTEGLDFLDSLYDALPDHLRKRDATPQEKARALRDHFKEIDIPKALENLLKNELEDRFYGLLSRGMARAARRMGRPVGFETGWAL